MLGLKALTFDTGGTILDWHHGLCQAFRAAGARRGVEADWPTITNDYRRRSLQAMVGQVDLNAAREIGYRTAFVHRPAEWGPAGPPDPTPHPGHDVVVQDFGELAQLLGT